MFINNHQKSTSPLYQAAVRAPPQPPDTGEPFEQEEDIFEAHFSCSVYFENYLALRV